VVRAERRSEPPETGRFEGVLPVVPGAFDARIVGDTLQVVAPIPREQAFVSWVSRHGREAGAIVALEPTSDGMARRSLPLSSLGSDGDGPRWAVVSSEFDTQSMALVGWPMLFERSAVPLPDKASRETDGDRAQLLPLMPPPSSFDVRDALWVDTAPARLAAEAERVFANRRFLGGYCVAAALATSLLLFGFWRRRAPAAPGIPLSDSAAILPTLAVLCLLFGLLALGAFIVVHP
jgi:hypothetical protein